MNSTKTSMHILYISIAADALNLNGLDDLQQANLEEK